MNVKCHIYQRFNHIAIICWDRFDHSLQPEKVYANAHMTNDPDKLSHVTPYKGSDVIYVDNGECMPLSHLTSKIFYQLVSSHMIIHGFFFFYTNWFYYRGQKSTTLAMGHKKVQLYTLNTPVYAVFNSIKGNLSILQHHQFGHPSSKLLQILDRS